MEEVKIGLEVHVQLSTKTKLFCSCKNAVEKIPNKNVCEVCLGFPGSKPYLNKKALEFAIKVALALNMEINKEIFFSRKTYFYPDMSKNFQITQHETFLAKEGYLEILPNRKIRIKELHLEEDPAKLIYKGSIEKTPYVLVDYNRSGSPLIEIVTYPDLKSAREARIFLQKLMQVLEFLYVTDFSKEGAMRVDANISLIKYEGDYSFEEGFKSKGIEGARIEIKNISGAKEVEKALNYEILRQKHQLAKMQETRMWDTNLGITKPLRKKEFEEEYGYIPEPDLPLFKIDDFFIEEVKEHIPELPDMKRERYRKLGVNEELIDGLLTDPELCNYFDYLCSEYHPKFVATFLVKYLKKTLNYHNLKLKNVNVPLRQIKEVMDKVLNQEILLQHAELIIRKLVEYQGKKDVEDIIKELRIPKLVEKDTLKKFVTEVLKEHWKACEDYRKGNEKAIDFLVGMVLKKAKGGADPKEVRKMIEELI